MATFPVEAGHIMLFARAIGDANPVYREEDGVHLVDLALATTNQDGQAVVTGSATARIDP